VFTDPQLVLFPFIAIQPLIKYIKHHYTSAQDNYIDTGEKLGVIVSLQLY